MMEIVYKKSIREELMDAIKDSKGAPNRIDHVELTAAEFRDLQHENVAAEFQGARPRLVCAYSTGGETLISASFDGINLWIVGD